MDGGDVLVVGRRVFVGRSSRTNDAGIEQMITAVLVSPDFLYRGIARPQKVGVNTVGSSPRRGVTRSQQCLSGDVTTQNVIRRRRQLLPDEIPLADPGELHQAAPQPVGIDAQVRAVGRHGYS